MKTVGELIKELEQHDKSYFVGLHTRHDRCGDPVESFLTIVKNTPPYKEHEIWLCDH